MIVIREVASEQLHDIRRRVLREGRPDARVHDERDGDPEAMHFAALLDDNVVGSASVYLSHSPSPDFSGLTYQLRYLAVETSLQQSGIGSQLMRAVEDRLGSRGVDFLWANGRDTALDFYSRTGWIVVANSEHLSPETQLPHHVIVKKLRDHRPFDIRRANVGDAEVITDLRVGMMYSINLTEDRGVWVASAKQYFIDGLNTGRVVGYVATVENRIVASAMAERRATTPSPRKKTGKIGYLHTVATLPTFRRRGISRILLTALINDLADYELDAIELHATDQGFSLYEALGFSVRGDNEMRRWMP